MPEKPNILVIDGNQNNRRKAMIDAFREWAIPYRLDCRKIAIESDQEAPGIWEEVDTPPSHYLLMLIHGGDAQHKNRFPAGLRVWYGGEPGYDNRAEAGDHQVYRSIFGAEEALTPEEARELIAFARAGGEGAPPGFLINPALASPAELEMLDVFHEILLAPPPDLDWATLAGLDDRFQSFRADWDEFKASVRSLHARHGQVTLDTPGYREALERLRDRIFGK